MIGSVDSSTSYHTVNALISATANVNPDLKAHLAYSAECTDDDMDYLHFLSHTKQLPLDIVFGYHTNHKLTKLQDTYPYVIGRECPATAGEDTDCMSCRRCYNPSFKG